MFSRRFLNWGKGLSSLLGSGGAGGGWETGGPPHLAGWLWLNALTAQHHLCQPACFLPLISDFPFLPKDVCKFLNFNSVTQICHSVESSASNFPGTMGAFEGQTVLSSREFFVLLYLQSHVRDSLRELSY